MVWRRWITPRYLTPKKSALRPSGIPRAYSSTEGVRLLCFRLVGQMGPYLHILRPHLLRRVAHFPNPQPDILRRLYPSYLHFHIIRVDTRSAEITAHSHHHANAPSNIAYFFASRTIARPVSPQTVSTSQYNVSRVLMRAPSMAYFHMSAHNSAITTPDITHNIERSLSITQRSRPISP